MRNRYSIIFYAIITLVIKNIENYIYILFCSLSMLK